MRTLKLTILFMSVLCFVACGARSNNLSKPLVWQVDYSKIWDTEAEEEFSHFVGILGEAVEQGECDTLYKCLRNRNINIYYDEQIDRYINMFVDCGDLPYILRAYFAFKTERPFIYTSKIKGEHYTSGNEPRAWTNQRDVYGSGKRSLETLFTDIAQAVHTGFFRTAPQVEQTDTYPIKINRDTVRPGTIYYAPNGHLLVVYDVLDNGVVKVIDGHTDNSLTHGIFSNLRLRGNRSMGGGFRNWRPYIEDGNSGLPIWTSNNQLSDWSDEQYAKSFTSPLFGEINYHTWVRHRLTNGEIKIDPLFELEEKIKQTCVEIGNRIKAVNLAIKDGIDQLDHPQELPLNIFTTEGLWEKYSTPGRDARLKSSFRDIYNFIIQSYHWNEQQHPAFFYQGDNEQLVSDFLRIWQKYNEDSKCQFTYKRSDNSIANINLNEVMNRLFDLSFDPYHCIEMRWGESFSSSCNFDGTKEQWYQYEVTLRNLIDKKVGEPTQLTDGPVEKPDIDIVSLLTRLYTSTNIYAQVNL